MMFLLVTLGLTAATAYSLATGLPAGGLGVITVMAWIAQLAPGHSPPVRGQRSEVDQ